MRTAEHQSMAIVSSVNPQYPVLRPLYHDVFFVFYSLGWQVKEKVL